VTTSKTFVVLIGQIGAGKSETGLRVAASTGAQFVSIDDLRGQHGDVKGDGLVRTLSARLREHPIVFESTGTAADFEHVLSGIEGEGWRPFVVMLDCSIETAMRRVGRRAEQHAPLAGGSWLPHLRWTATQLRTVPADVYVRTDAAVPDEIAQRIVATWRAGELRAAGAAPDVAPSGRFSFSQLASFDVCPLAYRYKYVDRRPVLLETEEMFLGARLHDALYFLYRGRDAVSEDDLLAYFARRVHDTFPPSAPPAQATDLIRRGSAMLEYHHANEYRPDVVKTVEQEKRFELELASGLSFIGRIDRVVLAPSGTYQVIDYKTSARASTSRPRIPDLLQLAAYGAATLLEYRVPAVILRQQQLGTRDDDELVLRTGDLPRIRQALRRWIGRVWRDAEFAARPGRHCRSCEYNPACPARFNPASPTALLATPTASMDDPLP
jgi:RecB family exonuclease/shikimate kinase